MASFASLLEAGLEGAPLLTPERTALVMHESLAAETLRLALERYFSLLETQEALALEPGRVQHARDDMLALMRLTLLSLPAPEELELSGPIPADGSSPSSSRSGCGASSTIRSPHP